jgi:cell division protein FtsL
MTVGRVVEVGRRERQVHQHAPDLLTGVNIIIIIIIIVVVVVIIIIIIVVECGTKSLGADD